MGLFDKIFGNNDDKEKEEEVKASSDIQSSDENEEKELTENQRRYIEIFGKEDDAAPGWDAITEALNKVYPDTAERHYGTIIKYIIGGKDPLDGISIYDNNKQTFHRHVVSFGMSELYYSPESADNDYSKWGCEFTMRLVPYEGDKDAQNQDGSTAKNEPYWAMNLMQNIARYVFETGEYFEAYHFMPANSPIRMDTDTKLVGLIFAPDPELGSIDTVHGRVDFLQMVGITQKELDWLFKEPTTARGKILVDRIRETNPMLITDLMRTEEYADEL